MSTRSFARVAALGVTVLLVTSGIAAADIPDEGALPDDALAADRYAGGDRYATAALTALAAHPEGSPTAIIARGDEFPDGLASAYLSGVEQAPILLTKPDELPLVTQDAFVELDTQRVIIVGGPAAISPSVEERLEQIFDESNVRRVNGNTRFETAAFVAQDGGVLGTFPDLSRDDGSSLPTAIVVSGRNFPDALAAGPIAHAAQLPILLTEPGDLPEITRIALDQGVRQVIIAGGPVSVSRTVARQLAELDGVDVVARVSGNDRTATAAALADLATEHLGWPGTVATVSLGRDFPDALSLAPAASLSRAPILLTGSQSEVGAATFAALQERCETLTEVVISGGEVAVDGNAELQVELATSCADHRFALTGEQVDGAAGDPEGMGTGWIWTESLCHAVRSTTSSPATAAHLHWDGDGDEALVADLGTPAAGDGLVVGCLTADDVEGGASARATYQERLRQAPSDFYVEVHTEDHPDGATLGRVAPPPEG